MQCSPDIREQVIPYYEETSEQEWELLQNLSCKSTCLMWLIWTWVVSLIHLSHWFGIWLTILSSNSQKSHDSRGERGIMPISFHGIWPAWRKVASLLGCFLLCQYILIFGRGASFSNSHRVSVLPASLPPFLQMWLKGELLCEMETGVSLFCCCHHWAILLPPHWSGFIHHHSWWG